MRSVLEFSCPHCHVAAGEACRSVGGRVVVEPHMKRLDACVELHLRVKGVVGSRDSWMRAARELYETKVLILLFGYVDDDLRAKARKERSIDLSKPWVRRTLDKGVVGGLACDGAQGVLL